MKPAFVFDPERCTGCEACRVACGNENGGGRDLGWRQVVTFNPARRPGFPTRHLSLACNHCERPACLAGCPAAAYRRDEATGAVLLDEGKCIGCRYCAWLCPYDVPRYSGASGTVTKCTFCAHRLAEGAAPACSEACPTGALTHGTREDAVAREPRWPGVAAMGLRPALVIVAREGRPVPSGPLPFRAPPRKIHPGSEWGLLLFTLVLPALVAWWGAGILKPSVAPSPLLVVATGLLATALAAAHLGRPLRAFRAISNVRSSWLSRELLLASGFLAAVAGEALSPAAVSRPLAWAALLLGTLALVSIDAVYRWIPRSGVGERSHSAEAVLTGLFLAGLAAGAPWLWGAGGALKGALLVRAFGRDSAAAERMSPLFVGIRGVLLLAACGSALADAGEPLRAVALALAGEAIDRVRFYLELEPASPLRLMHAGRSRPPGGGLR